MGARPFTPRPAEGPEEPSAPAADRPSISPSKRGREAAALLLFAVAAFLCLALASVRIDPHDPSIHGADWVGPVGSAIAGFLVQGFGLVAWLAPVELVLMGAPLFRGKKPGAFGLRLSL